MKIICMTIVATLLSTAAFAGQTCTKRGNSTYCTGGDEGFTAFYETSQGYIYSPQTGKSYSRTGNTLKGSDGSTRTKGRGGVTTRKFNDSPYDDNDVVVDGLFADDGLFD